MNDEDLMAELGDILGEDDDGSMLAEIAVRSFSTHNNKWNS